MLSSNLAMRGLGVTAQVFNLSVPSNLASYEKRFLSNSLPLFNEVDKVPLQNRNINKLHLNAPKADLVNGPAFKNWLGLDAAHSTATGKTKLSDQLFITTFSPLQRLCRLDKETYQTILGALCTSHLMLQVCNTRALSTIYELIENNPALQTQAHELHKILFAEYGNIGITEEHQYPHPRQFLDAYASLNEGDSIPILTNVIKEFVRRTTMPEGEEMRYLSILVGVEREAHALLHTQATVVQGIIHAKSPYLNCCYKDDTSFISGHSFVGTFWDAHAPFEGDDQSKRLTSAQIKENAIQLGDCLEEIEFEMRRNRASLQIKQFERLKDNIRTPDLRGLAFKPHSTDPTTADTSHVDLVNSLEGHFLSLDPKLAFTMQNDWDNFKMAYKDLIEPELFKAAQLLRGAEEKMGLLDEYKKQFGAKAEQYLNEEQQTIHEGLSKATISWVEE